MMESLGASTPRRRPRVLFVDHCGALGGAEYVLLDVAQRQGRDCTVLLFADGALRAALEAGGIAARIVSGGEGMDAVRKASRVPGFAASMAVIRLARRVAHAARDHDVIYANSQKSFVVACLAGWLSRRPVLWHLHDILDGNHFSATNIRVVVALANLGAARVLAVSNAVREAFVARGGRPDRVHMVHNAIDARLFESLSPNEGAFLRAELGLNGEPTIGVFGRLARWKGQHVVLRALAKLDGVHALFVSDALFPEDHSYAEELREEAACSGLAERVRFLGFRGDVPRLMQAVDIVVHSSVAAEPFGRVLVEGMFAERPVIATRAGGALEIIEDGVTGVLVAPGNATELAQAIRDLVAEPERARSIASAGRKRSLARFNLSAAVDRIDRHIAEVASATDAPTRA
jgi:glycosyltransferase involved in cell wall biosynthesis